MVPQAQTSTPSEALLPRLENVREQGPGRWLACCPAHDDRNPSLSIRETGDGTLLLKCWAGCGAADVVAAVNLGLSELFPNRGNDHLRGPTGRTQRWVPRDVLRAVATEALICVMAAEDLAQGVALLESEVDRLHTAVSRLNAAAREVADG